MVVGKVLRWSPWAPSSVTTKRKKKKKRFDVRLKVALLVGSVSPSSSINEGEVVAVRVRWRGPPTKGYLGRKKEVVGVTGEKAVSFIGVVDFGDIDDDKGNEFRNVCCFRDSDSFEAWQVSFSILHGYRDDGRKEKKMEELGTKSVNLAEWTWVNQTDQGQNAGVHGKQSLLEFQRHQVPITLGKNGSGSDAILYVDISFVEITKETSETRVHQKANENGKEEETSDDSGTFEPNNLELDNLLQLTDEKEKAVEHKSRNTAASTSSSEGSSPDLQLQSASKKTFLSWGKSKKYSSKNNDDSEIRIERSQESSITATNNESSGPVQDLDPTGRWETKELVSRDRQTKLKAHTFFASIDQRDESAGGESACTALVAVIADALHSKGANMPNKLEFDSLIREGSSEWQNLCNNASYIERFPNKHFDLDTILEANIRPISVLPDKSFIGFFQPESFESLRGAMSFEDIWNEIAKDVGTDQRVYVVSWNDHFFVLKVEGDTYYIMDTLGERLYEGCNKAYILRFDDSTQMYGLPEDNKDGDEVICTGKECCREFIKRFLAAIPLREELELEEKGKGNANTALHQRLQIEFHLTKAVIKV